jgi:hypothetical protein
VVHNGKVISLVSRVSAGTLVINTLSSPCGASVTPQQPESNFLLPGMAGTCIVESNGSVV